MEQISQILASVFIFIGIYFLAKNAKQITNEKTFLLVFLTYVLGAMVLMFMADKLFFPNRQLLSKEAGLSLFALIKELLYILFGYYFAKTQNKE
jgi:hypothetical protein